MARGAAFSSFQTRGRPAPSRPSLPRAFLTNFGSSLPFGRHFRVWKPPSRGASRGGLNLRRPSALSAALCRGAAGAGASFTGGWADGRPESGERSAGGEQKGRGAAGAAFFPFAPRFEATRGGGRSFAALSAAAPFRAVPRCGPGCEDVRSRVWELRPRLFTLGTAKAKLLGFQWVPGAGLRQMMGGGFTKLKNNKKKIFVADIGYRYRKACDKDGFLPAAASLPSPPRGAGRSCAVEKRRLWKKKAARCREKLWLPRDGAPTREHGLRPL